MFGRRSAQLRRQGWNSAGSVLYCSIPSIDKGRHGFDGQKCAHTASSSLTIRQVFSAGLFLSGHISAPTKLLAPASDGFSRDFWFLRCRLAGASQGEKGKKRRKDTLSGVFALVNRWYQYMSYGVYRQLAFFPWFALASHRFLTCHCSL